MDPFTARSRRILESEKSELSKAKNQDVFDRFCDVVRKKDAFLKKATDAELEGIFLRLTPSERLKYSTQELGKSQTVAKKKRPSDISTKSARKVNKEKIRFIDDEVEEEYEEYLSSDDVSLVSESVNELMEDDEEEERVSPVKKSKKQKKEKSSLQQSATKKFAWT